MDSQTTRDAQRHAASTAEVIEGLNDLLKLDHDAIGAYEIAIEKLKDRDHADQIAGFRRDHERHIKELNRLIAELGGTPTNEPHLTGPLKQGLQSLGALAGDTATLVAWRANEVLTHGKYDAYASRAKTWPPHVKKFVDEAALDEQRHVDWVTQVLNALGVPTAEGLEQGVATRMREAETQITQATNRIREGASDLASSAAGQVRETAGNVADGARNRVADSLDFAADRVDGLVDDRADRAGDVGHRVASGMHGSAAYLREADLQRIRLDMERNLRHHPVRTLAILFATGFVIGRLLR